ncbi:MAG: hypothetical protein E5Y63_30065 [Mesorhizobium sp.]|uniref:hypothetical protein n=1 Tax=Mesorhizobium sp. TaxID=1871066 RepID=UPI0011F9D7AD|nr:hypothetical protein [Mesorhizobium sp.]TIM26331.1 MAG: hypothetical protein E5Y63_30065 [Mesorhizobium sp.]
MAFDELHQAFAHKNRQHSHHGLKRGHAKKRGPAKQQAGRWHATLDGGVITKSVNGQGPVITPTASS